MTLSRRQFVTAAGAAAGAAFLSSCGESGAPFGARAPGGGGDWRGVRDAFSLSSDTIHMSAMLIASHPLPVREAIARHRDGLDRDPVEYLEANNRSGLDASRAAAADHLGVATADIALTDSTTMGVGLVYNGIPLRPGDEIVSTEQDYYVTIEALRQLSERTGATVRQVPFYDDAAALPGEEAAARILGAVTPATRVVALTWVHSSTGYKIPARAIADGIAEINSGRPEERQVLFCLDGVHGFGVEDVAIGDLGCDFFMAGCHKWLFGPRGTGIVAAGPRGFAPLLPSIPSFLEQGGAFEAWLTGDDDPGPTNGARMTPGGFKAFEHKWALKDAFEWHGGIGKAAIVERTHALARRLKEGLAGIDGVVLRTPVDAARSAGIVSFDVEGLSAAGAVSRLRDRRIIASAAPYAVPHVRLTPSIRNSEEEVDAAVAAVRELA